MGEFFVTTPDAFELVGYMAGGLRDCIGFFESDALEDRCDELFRRFGLDDALMSGFVGSEMAAVDLAAQMADAMDEIAALDTADEAVRELAAMNAAAFAEAMAMSRAGVGAAV